MKKLFRLLGAVMLSFVVCMSVHTKAAAANFNYDVTILFTHDLHSHFLPSADTDGGKFGGYARLMTVIEEQKAKYPDAVLVDGGDFSMGSLFQTAYATSALELRMMGAMGYDVTCFGNHEFDYLPKGLASMLNAAVKSGDRLPQIVDSNYLPPAKDSELYTDDSKLLQDAFDNYGVKNYTIFERDYVYYAIFGITGFDADDCAPNSGMVFEDPVAKAQQTVDEMRSFCVENYGVEPVVICLSHSGTSGGEGEDFELAKAVNGIDVIVSAHTHTTLDEVIKVNDTYIVSAGHYGKNLGVLKLNVVPGAPADLISYELIPVDENVKENKKIASLVEKYKSNVETDYLSAYGVGYDEVLVKNPYQFETAGQAKATQHESPLCNVFSDAYKWAVEKTLGEPVDVALTAAGVVRDTLPSGDVTVSDVFNAASLGVGTEGELVSVYITGKELKTVLEIDASVQPLMSAAQLYCSGV
ncbi:MAG: bifunctional metallophosphatase/5'-nucleotidase, partial [Oscillospiraceae bacterium]|nr:bifunctional metallophosphatase/5'-nucleotidase [Oscillospiraceae bacterium]